MIKLTGINKVYRTKSIETTALNNINLSIEKGDFISIMGPSGCGKSTLLNLIGLLDEPTNGSIEIYGKKVAIFKDKELAQLRNEHIGYIFQSFHLVSDLSVLDNVELPLLYRKGMIGSKRRQKAKEALESVGLSTRMKHYPNQLSGGQRQRVAIARAIVGRPQIILADEPTGNLDSVMGEEIMKILGALNENEKTTIVMVTHDKNQADKSQKIIRLFDGQQVN